MRPLRAQLIAVVTALAVLLPGSAFARAHFFCRMMNRVVATCCCEREAARSSDARCAKVRATDCCERLAPASHAQAAKTGAVDASVPAAAIVATVPALEYAFGPVAASRVAPAQARAPPIVGPPLFIAHCSLLT